MSSEQRYCCKLCDTSSSLLKSPCCNQWFCNDEADYNLYKNPRASCFKNHQKYTLCGFHHSQGHEGEWKNCQKCKEGLKTELYVWHSTNKYNYDKLKNPPEYEPTYCSECNCTIRLGEECHSHNNDAYFCFRCSF